MRKVGEWVFVPNAVDMTWKPYFTKIESIERENYFCKVLKRNLSTFNDGYESVEYPFDEYEMFDSYDQCKDYIANYYYDGYCRECKYKDISGTILRCSQCKHIIKVKDPDPVKWIWGYCKFTGIPVYTRKGITHSPEICRSFSPALPQYEDWSWERYENLLKNCDFNPGCAHHRKSCHKTCSFEKYMDEYISVPWKIEYEGRETSYALVKRKDWVNQDCLTNDGRIICWGLKLKPEYTKTGKLKKGTVNQVVVFTEKALF